MKTWQDTRLTPAEEREALTEAGLPLDPSEWLTQDVARAAEALDKAQAAKLGSGFPLWRLDGANGGREN